MALILIGLAPAFKSYSANGAIDNGDVLLSSYSFLVGSSLNLLGQSSINFCY